MTEVLHGQGATKERKAHSSITTKPRILTKGGMVTTYGDADTEHCLLDWMLNEGVIEQDQYDAGYLLRRLYYAFNKTGRWIDEGGKAYEGDHETESDLAEKRFHSAMKSVDHTNRGLIRFVCIEAENNQIAGVFAARMHICHGLDDLKKYFMGEKK